jgi:hypothetical protein
MLEHKEMMKIWEDVKANHKRLRECVGPHDFVEASYVVEALGITRKYRCLKCDGIIDAIACDWYKLGLKHGGRG